MKPDPQLQALLERASNAVRIDAEAMLEQVHAPRRAPRGRRVASMLIAAAIIVVAAAVVWTRVADDRSFVQGTDVPSGRLVLLRGANFEYGLSILDLESGAETHVELDGAVTDAAWSPDGTQLVVTLELPNPAGSEIVIVDADGSTRTIMERGHAGAVGPDTVAVDWSPDGSRLAFSGRTIGRGRTVSIIDADGSNEQVLDGHWEDVSWSPDGERLVLKGWLDPADEGRFDLWTVGADGTGFIQLTDDPRVEFTPAWSPDGSRILFAALIPGAEDNIDTDIFAIAADGGSAPTTVIEGVGFDGLPVWSPDGTWIAFASERSATPAQRQAMHAARNSSNHGMSVHIAAADGSDVREVAAFPGEGVYPVAWAE